MAPNDLPIACTLGSAELPARRREWEELCAGALESIEQTADGVRLSFRPVGDAEGEIRRLAALEAQCCAFADWTVRRGPAGPVLEVTAGSDGVTAVHALFQVEVSGPGRHSDQDRSPNAEPG